MLKRLTEEVSEKKLSLLAVLIPVKVLCHFVINVGWCLGGSGGGGGGGGRSKPRVA